MVNIFQKSVAGIKKEFYRDRESAVKHAVEKMGKARSLSDDDQMDLVMIFTRAIGQGDMSGLAAVNKILQDLHEDGRGRKGLAPALYPTLVTALAQGNEKNVMVSMRFLGRAISGAGLTGDEQTFLVEAIEACANPGMAAYGAGEALKSVSEVRIGVGNAKRLADVLRRGLNAENTNDRQFAFESALDVLQNSPMRDEKSEVLQNLARDCASAIRTGMVDTMKINEDSRAFLARMSAFAADGPVPIWKREPRVLSV